MGNKIILYLKNFDWLLFAAVMLLICFGLAEIYSIALSKGDLEMINFKKQLIFIAVGIALLFLFAFIDYYNLRTFSNYIYIIGLLSLVGLFFFGTTIRGTRGWFAFGGSTIQPVEFVKLALIIFLARYFSSVSIKSGSFKHLFLSGLGAVLLVFLVLQQPDFGSALILFLLWGALVLLAGFKKKFIIIIGLILSLAFTIGWVFLFKDYQKQRVITFLKPQTNSLDQSYNITQAIIAVGSGGLTGRGIGFGSQSQLKFLPEAQNDFIFAVIAEELGLFGVILVIGFFSLIFYRLLNSIRKINDDFGIYYILGLVALIFIEMFINISMNIGLLPVVGISLPFLSYGGSAILSSLIMIGIAESIIIRSKIKY
jgi:rod shape determining protein RodA